MYVLAQVFTIQLKYIYLCFVFLVSYCIYSSNRETRTINYSYKKLHSKSNQKFPRILSLLPIAQDYEHFILLYR